MKPNNGIRRVLKVTNSFWGPLWMIVGFDNFLCLIVNLHSVDLKSVLMNFDQWSSLKAQHRCWIIYLLCLVQYSCPTKLKVSGRKLSNPRRVSATLAPLCSYAECNCHESILFRFEQRKYAWNCSCTSDSWAWLLLCSYWHIFSILKCSIIWQITEWVIISEFDGTHKIDSNLTTISLSNVCNLY